jgi:hypothetical protein
MPKSDTSTREVPSSERREHPGPHVESREGTRGDPYRHLGDRKLKNEEPEASFPRLASRESAEKRLGLGPQYQAQGNLSRPFEADTWRTIKLPAFSPIAVSTRKKQFHHVPIREVARAFRTWGPPQHRMSLEPSDLKGAWHQIELSRHIAHRDSEEQGAAPYILANAEKRHGK